MNINENYIDTLKKFVNFIQNTFDITFQTSDIKTGRMYISCNKKMLKNDFQKIIDVVITKNIIYSVK